MSQLDSLINQTFFESSVDNSLPQERHSVEDLYRRRRRDLLAFFRRRSDSDSEDAVQELFLRLWKKEVGGELDHRAEFYLFKSAANLSVDMHRQNSIKLFESSEDREFEDEESVSVESGLYWQQVHERLQFAILEMQPITRKVFHLHHYQGLKHREISDELGLSIRTVERHMKKALFLCHSHLEGYIDFT